MSIYEPKIWDRVAHEDGRKGNVVDTSYRYPYIAWDGESNGLNRHKEPRLLTPIGRRDPADVEAAIELLRELRQAGLLPVKKVSEILARFDPPAPEPEPEMVDGYEVTDAIS